jgi:hypothetical protein
MGAFDDWLEVTSGGTGAAGATDPGKNARSKRARLRCATSCDFVRRSDRHLRTRAGLTSTSAQLLDKMALQLELNAIGKMREERQLK